MKKTLLRPFNLVFLFFVLFTACADDDGIPSTPFLTTGNRAMLKEVVEVKVVNADPSLAMSVDFGDGTVKSGKASDVITHAYSKKGDYNMIVTVGEYKIEQTIRIYNLLALTEAMKQFRNEDYTKVWVMTHRAHTTDRSIPENSVSSVTAAIRSGAEIIECDTQLTKDGVVVVCHDQTINATTTGTGDITGMTYEEILKFNLRDRDGVPTEEKMPTLEEFLKAGRGKIYFNLDYSPRTAGTEQVFKVVSKLGMMEQVFFYCNADSKVQDLLKLDPDAHAYTWVGQHKSLVGRDGNYFIQGSYLPGNKSTNVTSGIQDGMLVSVNLLPFSGSGIPEYELDESQLDDLLKVFPTVKMIHTDVPELLITSLEKRGLR